MLGSVRTAVLRFATQRIQTRFATSYSKAQLHAFQTEHLGYRFNDPAILEQAMTIPQPQTQVDNDRLEFLGDGVLYLAIADTIYGMNENAQPGQLTDVRKKFVTNNVLATHIAPKLQLEGFLKQGGVQDVSQRQLADCIEAIIGAIYIDSNKDMDLVRNTVIKGWYGDILQDPDLQSLFCNPKGELNEYLAKAGFAHAVYEHQEEAAPSTEHASLFRATCTTEVVCVASELLHVSKRAAEQDAAEVALERLHRIAAVMQSNPSEWPAPDPATQPALVSSSNVDQGTSTNCKHQPAKAATSHVKGPARKPQEQQQCLNKLLKQRQKPAAEYTILSNGGKHQARCKTALGCWTCSLAYSNGLQAKEAAAEMAVAAIIKR
eukprot:TRINITY_DN681_c0_g1_i1.p1 TRINITY_DN681_c0_g1~~TRINITY_DN681_c0_g1_i1.p1  ORF type:complete len:377 (+),score=62.81 TRINITY_DN681_c0_g1_i1:91-1221(+)